VRGEGSEIDVYYFMILFRSTPFAFLTPSY
jgi:hypothetical protein